MSARPSDRGRRVLPALASALALVGLLALASSPARAALDDLCGTTISASVVLDHDVDCTGYTGTALTIDTDGVVILSVRNGSVAKSLGFRQGDIVVEVGGATISNVADLEKALSGRKRMWRVSVKRGERVLQLNVPG